MTESNLVRVSVAAERLSVSVPTIHRMLGDGRLVGVQLGKKTIRVTRESLDVLEREGASDVPELPANKFNEIAKGLMKEPGNGNSGE